MVLPFGDAAPYDETFRRTQEQRAGPSDLTAHSTTSWKAPVLPFADAAPYDDAFHRAKRQRADVEKTAHSTTGGQSAELPFGDAAPDEDDGKANCGPLYFKSVEKNQFPVYALSVKWKGGMETVLPYAGQELKVDVGDVDAVKAMADGWQAKEGNQDGYTPFDFKVWDRKQKGPDLQKELLESLANNRVVVIEGWVSDMLEVKCDEEGLKSLRGTLEVPVTYYDALERALLWKAHAQKEAGEGREGDGKDIPAEEGAWAPLQEFWECLKEPVQCVNMLDSPQGGGPVPGPIHAIAGDVAAWGITMRVGYSETARKLLKKHGTNALDDMGRKTKQKTSRSKALDVMRNAQSDVVADFQGPGLVPADSQTWKYWDLVTSGGYFTYTHHDAGGLCTWVCARDGAKLWGVVVFRDSSVQKRHSKNDMVKLFKTMVNSTDKKISFKTDDFELFVFPVVKGSLLIMPPGTWHMVYTPVNTIMTGGHFLTYETMHLTQWSRICDANIGEFVTNSDHVGVPRTLARMAIALRYLYTDMDKRAFLALASMILNKQDYVAKNPVTGPVGEEIEGDLDDVEAFRTIKAVCLANGISRGDVGKLSLVSGLGWDKPGRERISLEILRPKMDVQRATLMKDKWV